MWKLESSYQNVNTSETLRIIFLILDKQGGEPKF